MGPEVNIESILALEKRIEEGTGDIIQLKRARNSLLNISTRVPPEILGHIFCWNVTPVDDFDGLVGGSYNFVLVCYRWFEVASSTPELWSFWGNTLNQWPKRYQHRGTAQIDVRLCGGVDQDPNVLFDGPLRDALRDCAERDSIRTLHLSGTDTNLLRSILPVLIPDGQGIRCSSIESLILENPKMDVSNFFARCRFPKLRRLGLFARTGISTWTHLESHTAALTTLSLTIEEPVASCIPIVSQLPPIFASNPRLQQLSISMPRMFKEYGGASTPSIVKLPHLENLDFSGYFEPLFRLLRRIDHPERMEKTRFYFTNCRVADIYEILGPYLRDCIQRDGRFRDGLGIYVESSGRFISVEAATTSGVAGPSLSPRHRLPFLVFEASLAEDTGRGPFDKVWVDFIAHAPSEHVVCLEVNMDPDAVEKIISIMPNAQELTIMNNESPDGLPRPALDGPFVGMKLFPSPRYLHLYDFGGRYWSSLASYLIHQTSGGQVISLRVAGEPVRICPHLVESVRNVVEELILDLSSEEECRLGICSGVRESDSAGRGSLFMDSE